MEAFETRHEFIHGEGDIQWGTSSVGLLGESGFGEGRGVRRGEIAKQMQVGIPCLCARKGQGESVGGTPEAFPKFAGVMSLGVDQLMETSQVV